MPSESGDGVWLLLCSSEFFFLLALLCSLSSPTRVKSRPLGVKVLSPNPGPAEKLPAVMTEHIQVEPCLSRLDKMVTD